MDMFFELIEMIWDTVPKKICNGPMKIGTKFAIHENFRFYDLMNTFQHIFSIKSKQLKAICNGLIIMFTILLTMTYLTEFFVFSTLWTLSNISLIPIYSAWLQKKQIAWSNRNEPDPLTKQNKFQLWYISKRCWRVFMRS